LPAIDREAVADIQTVSFRETVFGQFTTASQPIGQARSYKGGAAPINTMRVQ